MRNTGCQKSLFPVFCHVKYKHFMRSHFVNVEYIYIKHGSTSQIQRIFGDRLIATPFYNILTSFFDHRCLGVQ